MIVCHLSDLHFGRVDDRAVEACLAGLRLSAPDLVVVTGDFTMHARAREFRAAADFLDRLPCPVLATPGNHDLSAFNLLRRFLAPWTRYGRHIGSRTIDRRIDDDLAICTVNSARRFGPTLNWADGAVSRRQIRQIDRFFADAPVRAARVLALHHPVVLPDHAPGFRPVRRHRSLLACIRRRRIDAVLCGHLHREAVLPIGPPPDPSGDQSADPAPVPPPCVQLIAASPTTLRERGSGLSFFRIDASQGWAHPEVWRYEHGRFAPAGGHPPPRLAPTRREEDGHHDPGARKPPTGLEPAT